MRAFFGRALVVAGAGLALAVGAAGCGSPTGGPVSGKVTMGEKTVTSGTVTFTGEKGKIATASIESDGTYKVLNPPMGLCKVTVRPAAPILGGQGAKAPSLEGGAPKAFPIPKQYGSPDTSGLTFTVTSSPGTYDIPLTAEKTGG